MIPYCYYCTMVGKYVQTWYACAHCNTPVCQRHSETEVLIEKPLTETLRCKDVATCQKQMLKYIKRIDNAVKALEEKSINMSTPEQSNENDIITVYIVSDSDNKAMRTFTHDEYVSREADGGYGLYTEEIEIRKRDYAVVCEHTFKLLNGCRQLTAGQEKTPMKEMEDEPLKDAIKRFDPPLSERVEKLGAAFREVAEVVLESAMPYVEKINQRIERFNKEMEEANRIFKKPSKGD